MSFDLDLDMTSDQSLALTSFGQLDHALLRRSVSKRSRDPCTGSWNGNTRLDAERAAVLINSGGDDPHISRDPHIQVCHTRHCGSCVNVSVATILAYTGPSL